MGGQCRHCAEPAHPLLYIHTVDSRTIPISRRRYDGLLPNSLYAADYFLWLCADLILPSRWQLAAYSRTTQTFLSLGERHRAEAFLQRRLLASAGHQLFQVTVYLHYGNPSTYSIRLAIAIRQSTKKIRIELCRTSLPYA